VSFVASPTELIKCRLQHQGSYASALERTRQWQATGMKGPAPTLYKGPADVLGSIWKIEGGVRGLATGLGSTLVREVPGNGLMFLVYEALKMSFARWQVCSQALRVQVGLEECVLPQNPRRMMPLAAGTICMAARHTGCVPLMHARVCFMPCCWCNTCHMCFASAHKKPSRQDASVPVRTYNLTNQNPYLKTHDVCMK
jgi:hypothetical protein